jgi:hypothetical protein
MPVENPARTLAAFSQTLAAAAPPAGLAPALAALWWAAKDEWTKAHEVVQGHEGEAACDWVHAYLHRVEGDLGNAGYWYRQAGKPAERGELKAEWAAITGTLLAG